jgi:hypothetical protein
VQYCETLFRRIQNLSNLLADLARETPQDMDGGQNAYTTVAEILQHSSEQNGKMFASAKKELLKATKKQGPWVRIIFHGSKDGKAFQTIVDNHPDSMNLQTIREMVSTTSLANDGEFWFHDDKTDKQVAVKNQALMDECMFAMNPQHPSWNEESQQPIYKWHADLPQGGSLASEPWKQHKAHLQGMGLSVNEADLKNYADKFREALEETGALALKETAFSAFAQSASLLPTGFYPSQLMAIFDSNGDGEVTLDEFVLAMAQVTSGDENVRLMVRTCCLLHDLLV